MHAPLPAAPRDAEHLRLLAIFHNVFAGLGLLGLAFIAAHFMIVRMLMAEDALAQAANPPPPGFITIVLSIYAFLATVMLAGAALNLMAGRFLRRRRARMFCMVVAGLNCLQVPLGTLLGVFTLLVLNRDSVREAFGERAGTAIA